MAGLTFSMPDIKTPPEFWIAVGSIGTFLAVLVAFWAITRDIRSQRRAARRSQSENVSAWIRGVRGTCAPDRTAAVILNGSPQPVYRVVAWLVRLQGGGGPATGEEMARNGGSVPVTLGVVPPGR